jgi:hypothetical protein
MHDRHELTAQEFRTRFATLLRQAEATIRDYAFLDIPCDREPWLDTGIDLVAGDRVTTFATGETLLKGTEIRFGADFQFWCRIGPAGEIFRGTRASHSFTAEAAGRLYVASYFPGEWATRTGTLATPADVYAQAEGSLAALVIRWRVEAPIEGLKKLAEPGDVAGLIAGEIDRLSAPVRTPEGWNYLWFVGPAEIYRPCETPGRTSAICCHTRRDVGLLQKDVVLPFRPDTRLRWSWCMEVLPSTVREDLLPSHDYLSIAVEFDNGQDITYYWSAELPVGTAYRCPIPTWTARETHVVVRSGPEGIGRWFDEERDVYQDYMEAIGGPPPARIVRVWLIAVSLFQGREGRCRYADLAFVANGEVVPVR